jgi:hypothetical protein
MTKKIIGGVVSFIVISSYSFYLAINGGGHFLSIDRNLGIILFWPLELMIYLSKVTDYFFFREIFLVGYIIEGIYFFMIGYLGVWIYTKYNIEKYD